MNKNASNEIKVGVITILFVLAIYVVMAHMGVIGKKKGRTFKVQFVRVGGITTGSSVRYAGVEIGKVTNIEIEELPSYYWDIKNDQGVFVYDKDGNPIKVDQAVVTIMMTNEEIFKKIPMFTDHTVVAISTSLMGDKWIEINPKNGELLKKEQMILGKPPTTIEDFIGKAESAIDRVDKAVQSVDEILGDPETQKNIKLSLENFKDLTANLKDASSSAKEGISKISNKLNEVASNINRVVNNANKVMNNVDRQVTSSGKNIEKFTGTLNRIALDNEGDIRSLVKNLVATSVSLKKTLGTIEKLVSRKEFSEDILQTLRNIKNTSEEVEGIAADIRAITSDGQIREDLKIAVHNAREAAQGANMLIKGVNNFLGVKKKGDSSVEMKRLIELNAEAEWDKETGRVSPNINVNLLPEHRAGAKIGMDSIGYDNLWNLQYRMGSKGFKPRVGIVRSQVGLGADVDLGKNMDVYLDAYNPRDVNVDITGRILFGKDFYLLGGVRDVFDDKKPVFGVGKRF